MEDGALNPSNKLPRSKKAFHIEDRGTQDSFLAHCKYTHYFPAGSYLLLIHCLRELRISLLRRIRAEWFGSQSKR